MYQLMCDVCNKAMTSDEATKMQLEKLEVHICRNHNTQEIQNKVMNAQFAIQDLEFSLIKSKNKLIDDFFNDLKCFA